MLVTDTINFAFKGAGEDNLFQKCKTQHILDGGRIANNQTPKRSNVGYDYG